MSKTKWSAEKTWKFVIEYRNRECLWNSKLSSYKDRQIKDAAYLQLSEMFDCGVNDVKIKIKNLRTTYIQEYKKIQESVRANNGKEGAYVPSLVWYNEMDSFLRYTNNMGKITPATPPVDKLEPDEIHIKEEADINLENVEQHINIPETSQQNREVRQHRDFVQHTVKKRKQPELFNIQTTLENLNNEIFEEHEFDIFGKSVAKQLKSFSSIAAALRVQSKIQTLLTEDRIQDQIAATDSNSQHRSAANQRFFYNQVSSQANWSSPSTVTEVCVLPSSTQDISNLSNESCTSASLLEDSKEFEVTFMS